MAWTQANFNEYMRRVRQANPRYERVKKSRIHIFTGLLKMKRFVNTPGHLAAIRAAWDAAPADARNFYNNAWLYVEAELFPPARVAPRVNPPPTGQRVARPVPPVAPRFGVPIPQATQAARVAVQREARVARGDELCDEMLQQVLDGVTYSWRVRFRIREVKGGSQGQSLAIMVTLAAFSGNGTEFQQARVRMEVGDVPTTHEGATVTGEVKRNWSSRIVQRWKGGVFAVLDTAGDELETYDLDFEFQWADPGDDVRGLHKVFAVRTTDATSPPDGTIDTHFWGVNDGGSTGAAIAHEFGHLIGNPDEYGNCTFQGRRNTRDNNSIMDNETTGNPKAGHFWLIGRHAARLIGADPARCVVRFNRVAHRVNLNHPWT